MVASIVGTNSPLLQHAKIRTRPGRPKKVRKRPAPPTNMYILYFQDQYREYTESFMKSVYDRLGGRNMRKFARDVAEKWRNLPQVEKDIYRLKFEELRQKKREEEDKARQEKVQLAQAAQHQLAQAQLAQAAQLQRAYLAGQPAPKQVAAPQAPQQRQAQVPRTSASTSAQGQGGGLPNP